jgi:hypothetical protein
MSRYKTMRQQRPLAQIIVKRDRMQLRIIVFSNEKSISNIFEHEIEFGPYFGCINTERSKSILFCDDVRQAVVDVTSEEKRY